MNRFLLASWTTQCILICLGITCSSLLSSSYCYGQLTHQEIFDRERIVQVEIQVEPADWDRLRKQSRDPGKAFMGFQEDPFTWFKGSINIDGKIIDNVGIRKKGFIGSLDENVPSLKVNFDKYEEHVSIDGINVLTLNNNKQDNSLMSQILAYDLFNAVGVQAPRCSFVRVRVNGNDLGLYLNVESIGKTFLQQRYGNGDGLLLEGTLADFYPKAVHRLEIKNSKEKTTPAKLSKLAEILASDTKPVDLEAVEQIVDIDNFLRYWAVESLIGFWDGYTNNQNNFWVYENKTNGKLYFMPWGADGAFMGGGFPGFGPRGPASVYAESMLANRLFNHPQIQDRYLETLRWVLENAWNEDELIAKIDQLEKLVMENPHSRQKNAPQGMRQVRRFIKGRREVIEKELENWPVSVANRPRRPTYSIPFGSVQGSFQTVWSDKVPQAKDRKGQLEMELQLNGEKAAVDQLNAAIHPSPSQPFGFGPPMPAIPSADLQLNYTHDGKSKSITLRIKLEDLAQSNGKPITVQGAFNDNEQGGGPRFGPFGGGKTFEGSLVFTEVSMKAGEPVVGKFELQLAELRGGFMDRAR